MDTSEGDLRAAEVRETNARAWRQRAAALKELSIAVFMIMVAVMVYLTFERLWPLLPGGSHG